MSGLVAVVCSWEDEGGVGVSDLTLRNNFQGRAPFFFPGAFS